MEDLECEKQDFELYSMFNRKPVEVIFLLNYMKSLHTCLPFYNKRTIMLISFKLIFYLKTNVLVVLTATAW